MDFEAEIAKFLGTATMKQPVKKFATSAIKRNGAGAADTKEQAELLVKKAKSEIIQSLPDVLKTSLNHPITEQDLISTYKGVTDDGKFQFDLSWEPNAVRRYSLYEDGSGGTKYINDIVALIYSGHKPINKKVWGVWKPYGDRVYLPPGWRRKPNWFLDSAIQEFNLSHDNVYLELIDTVNYHHRNKDTDS